MLENVGNSIRQIINTFEGKLNFHILGLFCIIIKYTPPGREVYTSR
jgi:hypothetical protein